MGIKKNLIPILSVRSRDMNNKIAYYTTDLKTVRTSPNRFTWGTVVAIHDIGPYSFIEYMDKGDGGKTCFAIYVDGKDTSYSSNSLERAMVHAISRKANPEVNTARHMAQAAYRVLNIEDD